MCMISIVVRQDSLPLFQSIFFNTFINSIIPVWLAMHSFYCILHETERNKLWYAESDGLKWWSHPAPPFKEQYDSWVNVLTMVVKHCTINVKKHICMHTISNLLTFKNHFSNIFAHLLLYGIGHICSSKCLIFPTTLHVYVHTLSNAHFSFALWLQQGKYLSIMKIQTTFAS